MGCAATIFRRRWNSPGRALSSLSAARKHGVDLLVNNAGVTRFENLWTSPGNLHLLVELDFKNYILMMRAAASHMVEHRVRGSLINITSSRGERGLSG